LCCFTDQGRSWRHSERRWSNNGIWI